MQLHICVRGNHKKRFEENGWELPKGLEYVSRCEFDNYDRLCDMFGSSSVIEKSNRYVEPADIGNIFAGDGVGETTTYITKRYNEIEVEYNPDGGCSITRCFCTFHSLRIFYEEITTIVNEYFRFEFPYHMFYTEKGYDDEYSLWMWFFEAEEYLKWLKENNIKPKGNYFMSDDGSVYEYEVKKLTQRNDDGKKDLRWVECESHLRVNGLKKLSADEMMEIFDERFGKN